MNPWPLVLAEVRRAGRGCAAVVALIAVAVALGATSTALERAFRLAAADAMPADVMENLQPLLANTHDLAHALPFAFDGLLVTALLLIALAQLAARRRSVGALRALGASPAFLVATVWLHGVLLIGAGVLAGLLAGIVLAKAMGAIASGASGFDIDAAIGTSEAAFAGMLLFAGSLFAAASALPLARTPAARLLRAD